MPRPHMLRKPLPQALEYTPLNPKFIRGAFKDSQSMSGALGVVGNAGALIFRMGFGGILYYSSLS